MKKIFKLTHSTKSEEIGTYSQIQTHEAYDRYSPSSYINTPYDGPINYDIQFPVFIMEGEAKKTDLLNCEPLGGKFLVISSNVLNLFKGFNIDQFQSFLIKVSQRDKIYDYYAFYLTSARVEYIDWKRSTFVALHEKYGFTIENDSTVWYDVEDFRFEDFNDYINKIREYGVGNQQIRPSVIRLSDSIHHDLFKICSPMTGYFCTEKFKEAIIKAGLTGFKFESVPEVQYFNP
jgi:hypothetical protein